MPNSLILKVERALQQSDIGLGKVRVDTKTRMALGLEVEDVIEVMGRKKTAARVFKL
mgnify:CR=1 FL=1